MNEAVILGAISAGTLAALALITWLDASLPTQNDEENEDR